MELNKVFKFEKHVNGVWLVVILLISGIGSTALAYYMWPRVTMPFEVKEPIEIINYTPELSLFPGETKDFNATVQNNSPITYNVTLDFRLSDLEYQAAFVTFSDEIYMVPSGQQNLTAWVKVKSSAPAISCSLTVDFKRVEETLSPGIGEDFTDGTWIENDPHNHITIDGPYHVDFVPGRDEDAYLYKDMGEGYFTDFTLSIDAYVGSISAYGRGYVLVLSEDTCDDFRGLQDNSKTAIGICFLYFGSPSYRRIVVHEVYQGSSYASNYHQGSSNAWYYLKLTKSNNEVTLKIYPTANDRTNDTNALATLSLILRADHSFRYLLAIDSYNDYESDQYIWLDVENLVVGIES